MARNRNGANAETAPHRGKRLNVGLMVSNLVDAFDQAIYAGAAQGAVEADVNLTVFPGRYLKPQFFDVERSRTDYQYNTLFSYAVPEKIDVLLVLLGTIGTVISEEDKRTFLQSYQAIPTILIADALEGYPSIGFDNQSGLRIGITELIEEQGCRCIGMVSGPLTSEDAIERLAVYKDVLKAHQLPVEEQRIVYGNFSEYSQDVVRELLDRNPDLDAVVFANDQMAIGGYEVFKERRIVIGEELKVMGFDDVPAAAKLAPGLTSVRADATELGRRALLQAVQYVSGASKTLDRVPTALVRRGSTGNGDGVELSARELSAFLQHWPSNPAAAAEILLRHVYDDRYELLQGRSFMALLQEYVSEVLSYLAAKDPEIRQEKGNYLITRSADEALAQGEDVRPLFRLLDLLQDMLEKKDSCGKRMEIGSFLYTSLMQLGYVLAGTTEQRDAEADYVQWMSNSIARDMLTYGDGNDESYASVNDKLRRLHFTACYLYTLREPYVNERADVWHDWEVPERVLLKTYYEGEEGDIVRVPDAEQEMDSRDLYDNAHMDPDRRRTLIVNLIHINEEQLGFLVCEVAATGVKHLLPILAQLCAALKIMHMLDTQREIRRQLESNNEFLETISKVDELTGIYNRRGFREMADHQVHNPIYKGKKAILVFADLDNLKHINDRLGHDEGDFALRSVAQILKESMRTADIVARIGGDEFMALAIVNDATQGEQLKERIKTVMRDFNRSCEKPYYIGISVGYSEFVCGSEVNIETYMEQADAALYEDKKLKRREVMKSPEEMAGAV